MIHIKYVLYSFDFIFEVSFSAKNLAPRLEVFSVATIRALSSSFVGGRRLGDPVPNHGGL